MRAVLGMEKDAMAEAQQRLSDAENAAYEGYLRVKSRSESRQSGIYSPGAEYLLCQAQVQLMAAVVGVMTESLTSALSSFYKLRKAYVTLEAILQEERAYLAGLEKEPEKEKQPEDEEWVDVADEAGRADEKQIALGKAKPEEEELRRMSTQIPEGPDKELFGEYADAFVHSSSNMCFGMLLILLSMMPPALLPLVKMVGLNGDRKRGVALLWQASKFGNLNGAFAGLVLLGYYNNFISFCDIVPSSGSGAYPRERCRALLSDFRDRYPKVRRT
jgi:hypothetical protein